MARLPSGLRGLLRPHKVVKRRLSELYRLSSQGARSKNTSPAEGSLKLETFSDNE